MSEEKKVIETCECGNASYDAQRYFQTGKYYCTKCGTECLDLENLVSLRAEIERLKAEVEKAKREGVIEGFNAARIISASETTHHYLYQTPDDYLSSLQPKAEETKQKERGE